MPEFGREYFESACEAYAEYVAGLRRFVDAMARLGVQVRNVEPFANFAEVIVADEFGGTVQPPANKGFDVLTDAGLRIQVKSLRVSSAKPGDNGLNWIHCTRVGATQEGALIEADRLAIVVFRDFEPFALLDFPIQLGEKFPGIELKGIGFSHVRKLLEGGYDLSNTSVRALGLQDKMKVPLPAIPPAAPAMGE